MYNTLISSNFNLWPPIVIRPKLFGLLSFMNFFVFFTVFLMSKRLMKNTVKEVHALHHEYRSHYICRHARNIHTKFDQDRPINEHFIALLIFSKEVNENNGKRSWRITSKFTFPIIMASHEEDTHKISSKSAQ